KMLLLFNLNETLMMMDKGITIRDERLIDLGTLINKSYQYFLENKQMIEIMNNNIDKIKTIYDMAIISKSPIEYIKSPNNWIYRTCRMCVNDIINDIDCDD